MLISQEICLILFFKMKVLKIFAVFANLNSNSFALLKKKKKTQTFIQEHSEKIPNPVLSKNETLCNMEPTTIPVKLITFQIQIAQVSDCRPHTSLPERNISESFFWLKH